MADQILWNPAALGALKRHQLVSLSKKYGLKASGKNTDMIERLQEYAASLPSHLKLYLPEPAPTPAPTSIATDFGLAEDPPSPTVNSGGVLPSFHSLPAHIFDSERSAKSSGASLVSDTWEVLSESGTSLISPPKGQSVSISSWKSAGNGECLNEFGGAPWSKSESTRSRSSMLDFASSLKRSASRTLMFGRSASHPFDLAQHAETHPTSDLAPASPAEPVEEMHDSPPSPASTVGVPRRHSTISLLERPSTIRLCSPVAFETNPDEAPADDILPFVGSEVKLKALKDRRSMAPLRSSAGMSASLSSTGLGRKSMPALPYSTSASLAKIYPPLPDLGGPPVPPLPKAPEALPFHAISQPKPFVFGVGGDAGISEAKFSEAAQTVLREMNARLPEHARKLDDELLKGKKAEMKRLVSVNEKLGEGGWGLIGSVPGKTDRFAQAHEREFAKLASISSLTMGKSTVSLMTKPSNVANAASATSQQKRKLSEEEIIGGPSAPNGLPLVPDEDGKRQAKRSRLSIGPNYLGTLRDAGKSLANMLADADGKPARPALARRMKEKRDRRRSSLVKNKSKALSSRFGFLRNTKKALAKAGPSSSSSVTFSLATPPIPNESFSSSTQVSTASKDTKALRRRSAELTNLVKRSPDLPPAEAAPVHTFLAQGQPQKDRNRSTSANTILSTSSKIRLRPRIPDFGAPGGNKAAMGSTNTLGLPKSSSASSGKSMRKQSQADIIRNARPAPPPPATKAQEALSAPSALPAAVQAPPSAMKRSSTLYAPTASSLARMQATIKPHTARPLPVPPPPSIRTAKPFGQGSSRGAENLFAVNFHLPKPEPTSPAALRLAPTVSGVKSSPKPPAIGGASLAPPSPAKSGISSARSPLRPTSLAASRARAKASGLSAVKSKGDLKGEVNAQRRRAEIRAKQERMGEERALREMLGGMGSGSGGEGDSVVHAL